MSDSHVYTQSILFEFLEKDKNIAGLPYKTIKLMECNDFFFLLKLIECIVLWSDESN